MESSKSCELGERAAVVLQVLVEKYLETAEAVGSQVIADTLIARGIHLSSASVRSTLASLDHAGLLEQLHASAGRIPTRHGLALYVRHLMKLKPLTEGEDVALKSRFIGQTGDLVSVLRETSRLVSQLSQYASIIITPRSEVVRIKHIEFVQLGSHRILGILIAQNGTVFNRPLDCDAPLTLRDLEKMGNYCNAVFFGLTVEESVDKARMEMQEASRVYDEVLSRAMAMSTQVLENSMGNDVIIDSPWGMIDQMQTVSMLHIRRRLGILQEKTRLLQIMDQFRDAGRASVAVGSDDPADPLCDCGMVTAPYVNGRTILGCVGVMGPTRMDYSRAVPIVESAARYIGEWLEGQ
jgi:heat-inducible transcriptional repressor